MEGPELKLTTKGDAWRGGQVKGGHSFYRMGADDANGLGVSTIMPEAKTESCAYFAQLCPILVARMKMGPNSAAVTGRPKNLTNPAGQYGKWLAQSLRRAGQPMRSQLIR